MKWLSILASLVVLTGAAVVCAEPPREPSAAEKEVKRLEGTWKLKSLFRRGAQSDGEPEHDAAEDEPYKGMELIVKGNKWTNARNGKEGRTREFVVDPGKSPKTLALKNEKHTDHHLYILEGDTLKVLMGVSGFAGRPPKDWDDRRANLYVWERVKK